MNVHTQKFHALVHSMQMPIKNSITQGRRQMKRNALITLFVISLYAPVIPAQIPTNGLVAYYPFSGNANDSSGNSHHGTPTNVTSSSDRFDNPNSSYFFMGSASYVRVDHDTVFNLNGSNALTISCWVKASMPVPSGGGIWCKATPSGPSNYCIVSNTANGDIFQLQINHYSINGSYSTPFYAGSTGVWHHIVVIYDSLVYKIYRDNLFVVQGAFNTIPVVNTSPLYFGDDSDGNHEYFKGNLDDIRIYNRAISESEIQELYHEGGYDPSLVAFYPFNGNANDESGHENHGTNNGAILTADRFGVDDQAYRFDGTGYISVPNSSSLDFDKQFTFSTWVSVEESNVSGRVLSKGWLPTHKGYEWIIQETNPRRLRLDVTTDSVSYIENYCDSGLQANTWLHVAVTYDSTKLRFYLNGVVTNEIARNGIVWSNTFPLTIGRRSTDAADFFYGKIDDIRIYNRALSAYEVRQLYGNFRPLITSVSDIPSDQGGKVRITWSKMYSDSSGMSGQITSYGIWRRIPVGGTVTKRAPSVLSIANDTLGAFYDYLGTVNAVQSPVYNFVAQTLQDSSPTGSHAEMYLVTAHTADPNIYYTSNGSFGYSVDNIPPMQPSGLVASVGSDSAIELSWDIPIDPDVEHYDVYRASVIGFTPDPLLRIGVTQSVIFTDAIPSVGTRHFYRIVAVDVHGNQSEPSTEVSVSFPLNMTFNVNNNWNMVSVPLILDDFTKTNIYPTAASEAFSYEGSYLVSPVLQNGVGYWLRFSDSQSVSMAGLLRQVDTIDVSQGWNMVGSVSEPVPVTSLGSIPGGLITSPFFGYDGSYVVVTAIEPGKGYWVKVSEAGKLVLGASPNNANRITIEQSSELPPAPPEKISHSIPAVFALSQNYPNPFNPSARIEYGLPTESRVKLEVYNILGKVVATLANGVEGAGGRQVTWNASNFPSGIYFYRLEATSISDPGKTFTSVKKMVLMK